MDHRSEEYSHKLIQLVSDVHPDDVTCDECLGRIDEYAEAALRGRDLEEGLNEIQNHLEQCVCCRTEYEALIDAIKQLDA